MEEKKIIAISVQNLLEYARQSGNLSSGSYSSSRAAEGARGHAAVRKTLRNSLSEDAVYDAEVPVSFRLKGENTILDVTGRIDGVLKDASGITIHEIKTTTLPLDQIEHDHSPQHWAQAKCYAYMFAQLYGLDYMAIHLTYYQLDEKHEKSFIDLYSIEALEEFFMPLARECLAWQEMIYGWYNSRDKSIEKLEFPYPGYRLGQREFIDSVYDSIEKSDVLFAQAPTGTGKTIAALYPSVKALGEGLISKVFYLTSKTTTRALAEKALEDMRDKGNAVCPFELSFDLSLWCDMIICDYNYLFDPRVYLKRFFTQRGDYCFLIDEAHNLVDRARDMYSSELSKRPFFELKRGIKAHFDEQSCAGFEYAYTYPGINRVLQAAGRVIRTENDMGVVVLLDERFSYQIYRELLPSEWSPIPRASDRCLLSEVLQDFWGG